MVFTAKSLQKLLVPSRMAALTDAAVIKEFNICVLGGENVGKTSLCKRLEGIPFSRKNSCKPSMEETATRYSIEVTKSLVLSFTHTLTYIYYSLSSSLSRTDPFRPTMAFLAYTPFLHTLTHTFLLYSIYSVQHHLVFWSFICTIGLGNNSFAYNQSINN